MSKRSIRKKRHIKVPPKPSKAKKILTLVTILLTLAFAAAAVGCGADIYRKKTRCTEVIYGNVTNVTRETYHYKRKTRIRLEADIVIQSDGLFPAQTIHTENQLYAKQVSIAVFYDPEDTDLYYLQNDLSETLALTILFAVITVGETALSVMCIKSILRERAAKHK